MLRSKTMWAAAITTAAGVVQQVAPFIPEHYAGIALAGAGVAMAVLRAVTTQPLSARRARRG